MPTKSYRPSGRNKCRFGPLFDFLETLKLLIVRFLALLGIELVDPVDLLDRLERALNVGGLGLIGRPVEVRIDNARSCGTSPGSGTARILEGVGGMIR